MDPEPEILSDKEKQTLRLIVRGHDAKSAARALELSVHTINERLRAARRKLGVTSSREAARVLFESETETYEKSGYKPFGDADLQAPTDDPSTLEKARRPAYWIGATIIMSILAIAIAIAVTIAGTAPQDRPTGERASAIEQAQLELIEEAARDWLRLVDASDWQGSFDAAGQSFQEPNTVATWRSASEQARVPLGAMVKRDATITEFVNAPPHGYYIAKFRTTFEKREDAVEAVTLELENGGWKVVGYVID
ncbi:helix-turn-helix domain-containing protein [Erythrobacter crassostreae]|uniref:DUF4019 domain-containing protein n=1 Tax=Erythrobacter crassostreae TaxID=2828328 RepID=A0A9X1F278_9SPHN|nr:DUF4019 domain-containing protein [Erythrobacter crassostrea]MBV7258737.1 DUF4019 domain-containing protein [Erythrobacter crassostrea]